MAKQYHVEFCVTDSKLHTVLSVLSGEVDHLRIQETDSPGRKKAASPGAVKQTHLRGKSARTVAEVFSKAGPDISVSMKQLEKALEQQGYKAATAGPITSAFTRAGYIKKTGERGNRRFTLLKSVADLLKAD